jgi:hypothetical protein
MIEQLALISIGVLLQFATFALGVYVGVNSRKESRNDRNSNGQTADNWWHTPQPRKK